MFQRGDMAHGMVNGAGGPGAVSVDKMSEYWSVNEGAFVCLYDKRRTLAFRRAIVNTVRPGDVVVELGAGSGVLSMFAADAGARTVYAVELDQANLSTLRGTIVANGYQDRIQVLAGDATTIDLPEQVDVIICEMIATALLEELQIPAMDNALRFARPGARVVLQEYHVFADLVHHANRFYGKTFDNIRYEFPDRPGLKAQPRSTRHPVVAVDFRHCQRTTTVDRTLCIPVTEAGVVNGLRLTGDTLFSDGSWFDFSVAYSFPVILPIPATEVAVGDAFEITLNYSMCEGPHRLRYSAQLTGC